MTIYIVALPAIPALTPAWYWTGDFWTEVREASFPYPTLAAATSVAGYLGSPAVVEVVSSHLPTSRSSSSIAA